MTKDFFMMANRYIYRRDSESSIGKLFFLLIFFMQFFIYWKKKWFLRDGFEPMAPVFVGLKFWIWAKVIEKSAGNLKNFLGKANLNWLLAWNPLKYEQNNGQNYPKIRKYELKFFWKRIRRKYGIWKKYCWDRDSNSGLANQKTSA